ncbi:hypothetical protein LPAF129_14860 [Ligilactobacillus pabuli]|uniref:Uncharacterized protein n=1 Tax=Ligilactobacillus pabuli TaxID=2886039 RepID=A0ABQ5JID7_9LACO|nr:hypothetical protein [Ligilactobacillus pabuli]GKS81800.1 hypothetical protein LPAF129_14860 [Ligilactobacillus pabuli]
MTQNIFQVAHCGQFDLHLDMKKLTISQKFLDNSQRTKTFQLSMLEVLSFLDVVDQYNTERYRVLHGQINPHWCLKLLKYIEESYLVKEIELPELQA